MSSLQIYSNADLISRMEKLVRTERKITHLVLQHIAEIEERRIYAELGFDGMYSYLVRGLGYSEGSAYRRLQSARLLKQIPEVAEKIESGSLNLSQLTQVQKGLKLNADKNEAPSNEQTLDILAKIENQNSFETQKTLAKEMNLPIDSQESVIPQRDNSVSMKLAFTEEEFAELELARSLLSHITHDGNWAKTIVAMAKKINKKSTQEHRTSLPQEKTVEGKAVLKNEESEVTKSNENINAKVTLLSSAGHSTIRRSYIPQHISKAVLKKANYCCEYVNDQTGQACKSRYQVQLDHIVAVAHGGGNEIQNLRALCRTHNLLAAKQAGLERL
jgi:Restriction endonuclease